MKKNSRPKSTTHERNGFSCSPPQHQNNTHEKERNMKGQIILTPLPTPLQIQTSIGEGKEEGIWGQINSDMRLKF